MPIFWTNLLNTGAPLLVATILAAGILAIIRSLGRVSKGLKNLGRLEEGLRTLFVVNDKQNHVQQSTLEVCKSLIDAVESGVCNGNIKSARERNEAALKNAKDARDAAQEFLIDKSIGKEA